MHTRFIQKYVPILNEASTPEMTTPTTSNGVTLYLCFGALHSFLELHFTVPGFQDLLTPGFTLKHLKITHKKIIKQCGM